MGRQRARGAQVRRVAWGCSLPCLFVLVLSPLVMLMMRSDRRGFAAGSTVYLISPRASARWRSERETFEKSMRNSLDYPPIITAQRPLACKSVHFANCPLQCYDTVRLWNWHKFSTALLHSVYTAMLWKNSFPQHGTALVHKNSSPTPRNLISNYILFPQDCQALNVINLISIKVFYCYIYLVIFF